MAISGNSDDQLARPIGASVSESESANRVLFASIIHAISGVLSKVSCGVDLHVRSRHFHWKISVRFMVCVYQNIAVPAIQLRFETDETTSRAN